MKHIKKILTFCMMLFIIAYGKETINHTIPQYSYILKIKLPAAIQATSSIAAYYQGHELKFDTGCIMLPEKQERLAFSIIITPEVEHKAIKNNIWYLKRIASLPCRWFDLTLTFETSEPNKLMYQWHIQETDINEMPLRIPDHAILIQTDPKLIDTIEAIGENNQKTISCDTRSNLGTIYFPTIIFKKELTKDEFEHALIYPSLAIMDTRAIHEAVDSHHKVTPEKQKL